MKENDNEILKAMCNSRYEYVGTANIKLAVDFGMKKADKLQFIYDPQNKICGDKRNIKVLSLKNITENNKYLPKYIKSKLKFFNKAISSFSV